MELASSCENVSALCALEVLFPPAPPKKKINNLPKNVSPPICHHQCAVPGIDRIGSPHPRIQCSGPLQKDPHPEPASGRALRPSRTRFSSPVAIARETATGSLQQPPQKEHNRDACPRNGPGLPPTGPSPGANPPTYPSSLPRALGKLPGNIPSRGHEFFSSIYPSERGKRARGVCRGTDYRP